MTPSRASRRRGGGPLLLALALIAAAGAAAGLVQAPSARRWDDELARRTFANAEQLLREGKVEQALRDFEQVSSAYPDSAMADDALYRIGSYYYPIETVDELGKASGAAVPKAREFFSKIHTNYPREDSAPRALFKLGLIALDPSNSQRNLDEAYASFTGVVNIYPSSDLVGRALFGAGFADFMAGRYDKSITSFERVAEEHASEPAAEDARFYMGLAHARHGSFVRALEEFQQVRDLHPGGRLSARALDRLTQIYKLKVKPGLVAGALFTHDASYAPDLPADAARGDVSLALDPEGVLHMLDARTGAIYRLRYDGKLMSTGTRLEGAVSISVDQAGVELLAAGSRIRAGVDTVSPAVQEGGALRPLTRVTAAVRAGFSGFAMLDEYRNEVLLHTDDPAKPKLLYRDPAGRARLSGLAAGAEGKLYTIDRRARRILEISSDATFREIGADGRGRALEDPVALAADDIGDLFVLDRRAGAVLVMTTEGKLLATVASEPGAASEFGSPTALAVGPRAEIYVHDAKRRTVLRFR